MIEVRPEGRIYETCSDRPSNWEDMKNKFRYTMLKEKFHLPWPKSQRNNEDHPILPPSFNHNKRRNTICARLLRNPV